MGYIMIRALKKIIKFKNKIDKMNNVIGCICKGNVNIYRFNKGNIDVHPSVLLNSDPVGYHVGMPFETTLIADRPDSLIKIGENTRIHGTYIHA